MRRMLDIRSNELDEHGSRVITIDLPALRTHPSDIRRVLCAAGPLRLTWTVSRGEHTHRGEIDPEDPTFRLTFTAADPDGAWELRIEGGDEGGSPRELWKQLLFVQKRPRIPFERVAELARRYAPIFLYSSAEAYFPVSLETLLCSEPVATCPDVMAIRTIFGTERVPLPQLGEFLRFNGHSEYLLDFNLLTMWRSVFAQLGGDPRASTIYWSYLEDPDSDRFFVTYHQIYAFDTKTGIARFTGIGPHVFDRESMILVFEGGDRPTSMIVSGHLENQPIFFLNRLKVWHQGRLAVPFDDPRTLKLGDHPVIAVAEGSHALYPTSGLYQLSLLREIAGYLDPEVMGQPTGARLRPDQILAPPNLRSAAIPRYALRSFGFDRLTSHLGPDDDERDGHRAFLTFSGYWVDIPGTTNARFPPFTRKVAEVVRWVDGAYAWHWDDVPASYHENGTLILSFMRDNLEDL